MAIKLAVVFLALVALAMALHYRDVDQSSQVVDRWFRQLPYFKQRLTTLNFYIHDIMTGDHPTTVPIAQANMTATSPTRFGLVFIMDSPVTVGPELDSKVIGCCQGTFTFFSQSEVGLLLTLNFIFTDGPYAGSTLSILGPKKNGNKYREYPIISGSCAFRLAQGVAIDNMYTGQVPPGTRPPTECQAIVMHFAERNFNGDMVIKKGAEDI